MPIWDQYREAAVIVINWVLLPTTPPAVVVVGILQKVGLLYNCALCQVGIDIANADDKWRAAEKWFYFGAKHASAFAFVRIKLLKIN